MSKEICLPAWLSVLSLAVALIVPLGVTLIADTSMDEGRKAGNVEHNGAGRLVPLEASAEQSNRQKLTFQAVSD